MAARLLVTFNGATAAGNISIPSLKAGDLLLVAVSLAVVSNDVTNATLGQDFSGAFPKMVLTDGELFQLAASDFSSVSFVALFEREVML